MPCYHPQAAFRSPSGDVTFVSKDAVFKNLELPCGQCVGCRLERTRQWSVRLMHEGSLHEENCFITLTYNSEHLPPDLSLNYKHFQDFLKRYRKKVSPKLIRFYMAGEYGEERSRPHYHAIIFGHMFDDLRLHAKSGSGDDLYTSATLQALWPFGFSSVGRLTSQSAAYVARYVMKKVTGRNSNRFYELVDPLTGVITKRVPEFSNMSRRPGIGKLWFDKFGSDVYPHDRVIVKGKAGKPPRYYDKLQGRKDPEMMQRIKNSRIASALDRKDDNTAARLSVKETIVKQRLSNFKRKLK